MSRLAHWDHLAGFWPLGENVVRGRRKFRLQVSDTGRPGAKTETHVHPVGPCTSRRRPIHTMCCTSAGANANANASARCKVQGARCQCQCQVQGARCQAAAARFPPPPPPMIRSNNDRACEHRIMPTPRLVEDTSGHKMEFASETSRRRPLTLVVHSTDASKRCSRQRPPALHDRHRINARRPPLASAAARLATAVRAQQSPRGGARAVAACSGGSSAPRCGKRGHNIM